MLKLLRSGTLDYTYGEYQAKRGTKFHGESIPLSAAR
jgi:hypothetical protein